MLHHICPVCQSWVSYDAVYGYGFCPKCGNQGLKAQNRNSQNAQAYVPPEEPKTDYAENRRKLEEVQQKINQKNLPTIISGLDFLLYPCIKCSKMIDKKLIHFGNCPHCNTYQDFDEACKKIDRCPRCFFDPPKCTNCDATGKINVYRKAGGLSVFFGAKGSLVEIDCPHCINGKCGRCYGDLDYNDDRQFINENGGATRMPAFKTEFNDGKVHIDRTLQQQNDWLNLSMGPKTKQHYYNLVTHPNFDTRVPLEALKKIRQVVSGLKFKMIYCIDEWSQMISKLNKLESSATVAK